MQCRCGPQRLVDGYEHQNDRVKSSGNTLQEEVRRTRGVAIADDALPWAPHLRVWAEMGFSVAALRDRLGEHPTSDDVIAVESVLTRARAILGRLDRLPARFHDAGGDLALRLYENPFDADEVQNEFAAMMLARAPWIPAAERSRARWSAEGRTIELEAWLRRLTDADASSRVETDHLVMMIEQVQPRAEVRRAIEALEVRQRQREGILQDLLEMLEMAGWRIDDARIGTLAQRFDAAGELQRMDVRAREVVVTIERDIEPWRPNSAATMMEQLAMIKAAPEHDLLERISTVTDAEVAAIIAHRAVVREEIEGWSEDGVVLPFTGDAVTTFKVHEAETEALRASVSTAADASERILAHQADGGGSLEFDGRLWHAEDAGLLVEAAARLDREAEVVGMMLRKTFTRWRSHGIEIEGLLDRIDVEPRSVAAEAARMTDDVERVIEVLAALTELDDSLLEDDRLMTWAAELRDIPTEQELPALIDRIDRLERRQKRHRESLDEARRGLGGSWPDQLDADSLNLAEYEDTVRTLESGRHFDEERSAGPYILPREIERWAAVGWDVSGLRESFDRDPDALMKELPLFRAAIEARGKLVQLLRPLPWGRDLRLATEVEANLRRPEALADLETRRRDIAIHLASLRPASERALLIFEPRREVVASGDAGRDELQEESISHADASTSADEYSQKHLSDLDADGETSDSMMLGEEQRPPTDGDEAATAGQAESSQGDESEGEAGEVEAITLQDGGSEVEDETAKRITAVQEETLLDRGGSVAEAAAPAVPVGEDGPPEPMPESELVPAVDWLDLDAMSAERPDGISTILDRLGIDSHSEVGLADIAAAKPRDMRVQRLVRLIDPVAGVFDAAVREELLASLDGGSRTLDEWTALRLVNRRARSGDGLLADSERLVERLAEVPGPGVPLPIGIDATDLPASDDADAVRRAVAAWRAAVELPRAGHAKIGVR